jgi:hypothetical protein
MNVATTPLAAFQIELEVAVTLRGLGNMFKRRCAERGTSKICVKDDAGRIDNSPQRKASVVPEFLSDRMIETIHLIGKAGMSLSSFGYLFANKKKYGSGSFGRRAARMNFEQARKAGSEQKIVHRRQKPVEIACFATVVRLFDTLHRPTTVNGNVLF